MHKKDARISWVILCPDLSNIYIGIINLLILFPRACNNTTHNLFILRNILYVHYLHPDPICSQLAPNFSLFQLIFEFIIFRHFYMEQQHIDHPNNQNPHPSHELPIDYIQNSILTHPQDMQHSQHSRTQLKGSQFQSRASNKGQFVISYNFDHDNPANSNAITHNIFIGWDDEPVKKKPIRKIKLQQASAATGAKTPVRNRATMINHIVSEQQLKNEEDNDISINELTKRIGNDIKDKYNSMFIAPPSRTKSKQSSLYYAKVPPKQERMPLIQKNKRNDKDFNSLNIKKNQVRNASCKMLKPIPNPVLQTLRKSENQCRQKQTPKYLNDIIPQTQLNKENNNRVKLASFASNKDKPVKPKDAIKNSEEKLQYRNGRTIQHNQLPKLPDSKPVKPTENSLKKDKPREEKQIKKSPSKSPKQKQKKIFNTANNKMCKQDGKNGEKMKEEESGQFSNYGADTLKLIEDLQKMESEESLNKSQPQNQCEKQNGQESCEQKLNSIIQDANGIIQDSNEQNIQKEPKQKPTKQEIMKKKEPVVTSKQKQKKRIPNNIQQKQPKSNNTVKKTKIPEKTNNQVNKKRQASLNNPQNADTKQTKKDIITSEQSKQKQLSGSHKNENSKSVTQKNQADEKKPPSFIVPKLNMAENNQKGKSKQKAPMVNKQDEQKQIDQIFPPQQERQSTEKLENQQLANQSKHEQTNIQNKQSKIEGKEKNQDNMEKSQKNIEIKINEQNKNNIEKKQKQQLLTQKDNKEKIKDKNLMNKSNALGNMVKGQQKKQVERKNNKPQENKLKSEVKKQMLLSSPRSPRMYNAVYLQEEEQTAVRSTKNISQDPKGKTEATKKLNQQTTVNNIEPKKNKTSSKNTPVNTPIPHGQKMQELNNQNIDQLKGQQNLRSPRQLLIKSNEINMKITSRESKSQVSPQGQPKNQKQGDKFIKKIDDFCLQQNHKQQSAPKRDYEHKQTTSPRKEIEQQGMRKIPEKSQSKKSNRPIKDANPSKVERTSNSRQKDVENKPETKLQTHRKSSQINKQGSSRSTRKQQIHKDAIKKQEIMNQEPLKETLQQKVGLAKQEKKITQNQAPVKKSNSGAAIHRKKLDLKLMNRQGQEQLTSKREQQKVSKTENKSFVEPEIVKSLRQKQEKTNLDHLQQSKQEDTINQERLTDRKTRQQKNKLELLDNVEQKSETPKRQSQIQGTLADKNKQKQNNPSPKKSGRSSQFGKVANSNSKDLRSGQKIRRSEYADSDSQLQAGPHAVDSQAPKIITCISKKSSQSQSSIRSIEDKRNKTAQPKPIKIKQLKNASVQMDQPRKKEAVQVSIGTSRKQIQEKGKRKSIQKKVMVDQEVQHSEIKNQCENNGQGDKVNLSVDDNIISFANITCQPNIEQTQKQSFLDIGNTDKLNRTDFIQVPKIIQRKLNNNSNSNHNQLSLNNKAKDRSLFERAPVLSFVYDEQKKLTDQQSSSPNQRMSTDACSLSSQMDISEEAQNCLILKSLRIVLEIDPWLIDRIIEPFLTAEGENQIWLYCKGHWKCFRSNHLEIMSIFRDVIVQALRTQYNITNPNAIGVEEVLRMITGFRVMQLKNKKKLSQELSYHIGKGYVIKGISAKPNKPIYSITAVETTAKMDKLIKIEIKQKTNMTEQEESKGKNDNILWIKQEVFEKYFDYFLLICCREESWWTSKVLKNCDISETLVYTMDSLTNSIGSVELHADCELSCKIDLYREVKPKILKFIGSVNEKNKPKRSSENPNPSLCFNFAIKGRYYIMIRFSELPIQAPTIYLSLQSTKQIGVQYLETIKHDTYKNNMSEYVEINSKVKEKSMASINKSKSTIKNRQNSAFRKDAGNLREQFINFLMEDAKVQKNGE